MDRHRIQREHLRIANVPNLREAVRRLQALGFTAIGADPEGESSLYDPLAGGAGRRVLILGGEGAGLGRALRDSLDARIRIPMNATIASLNVATATAVILFEWARRDQCPGGGDPPEASSERGQGP